MSRHASRARRAFTLVEILVAVAILGIIGAGLVRLIISQSRFTERQMAKRTARMVSRNAMNILLTDLRMVQDSGGLLAAASDSVTVRVPVAFGLYCGGTGVITLSLLPVDSAMTALGFYNGWAIRDSVKESYRYSPANTVVPFANVTTAPNATACTDNGISQVTYLGRTGRIITLTDQMSGSPITPGWPVFIYQLITYRFEASSAFPGRVGLWRKVKNGNANDAWKTDEIIAPFDASAGFRYYVLNGDTAQTDPPPQNDDGRNSVRGIQLYLAGSSPVVPAGTNAEQAALVTGVFFKNRRDP